MNAKEFEEYWRIRQATDKNAILCAREGGQWVAMENDALELSRITGLGISSNPLQPECRMPEEHLEIYAAKVIRAGRELALLTFAKEDKTGSVEIISGGNERARARDQGNPRAHAEEVSSENPKGLRGDAERRGRNRGIVRCTQD